MTPEEVFQEIRKGWRADLEILKAQGDKADWSQLELMSVQRLVDQQEIDRMWRGQFMKKNEIWKKSPKYKNKAGAE